MIEIEIDGIGTVEVDAAFADLSAQEQERVIQEIAASAGNAPGTGKPQKSGNVDTQRFRAAIGQGLGMGFGDEIEAALRNPASALGLNDSGNYAKTLEEIRGKLSDYREDRPLEAMGYEIGGAVAPALIAGALTGGAGGAAVTAQTAARLAPTAARAAKAGAASGAISGFGAGEGGVGNRLQGSAIGGTIGGALGAAAPVAVQQVGRGVRQLADGFGLGGAERATQFAERKLLQALEQDNLTPEQAGLALDEARRAGVPDITIADLGENLRGKAWRAQAMGGENRQKVVDQFDERRVSQAGQIADNVSERTGLTPSADYLDNMRASISEAAAPLYREAYSQDLPAGPFKELAKRNAVIAAYNKQAKDLFDIEGRELPDLKELLQSDTVNTEVLHQVKIGLDKAIEAETDALGKVSQKGRALVNLKSSWNERIVNRNENYSKANKVFSDGVRVQDAFKLGTDFNRISEAQLSKTVRKMSVNEKAALRNGIVSKVQDLASTTSDGTNFVSTIFGSPKKRAALELAFESEAAFKRFEKMIGFQRDKVRTNNKVMGGSATAERLLENEDAVIDPALMVSAAGGGLGELTRSVLSRSISRIMGMNERAANEMSKRIFEMKPSQQRAFLQSLRQRETADKALLRRPERQPEVYSSIIGNQAGLLSSNR